jgi:glyoxylase-like metal-dependent hydrolase (beta-lactamase superfamily II)
MTGPGTNTYLVGTDAVVVIDPGPEHAEHHDRIVEAGAGRIRWIVATHTHADHSPGVAALAASTGAEVLAFDARDGLTIDRRLADGDCVGEGFSLLARHTPGHASNHLCFELADEALLFSGDHIMQGSTVVITPTDGDMGAYLTSLRLLAQLPLAAIAPAHGHVLDDPAAVIDYYLRHRTEREEHLAEALARRGRSTVSELVADVYTDVPEALHPVARYSVWAHLLHLRDQGRALGSGGLDDHWQAT